MQKSRNTCQSSRPKRCNIFFIPHGPKSAQKIPSTLTQFLSVSHFYDSDTGRKKWLLLIPRSMLMPCESCRMPAGTIQLSNINEHLAGFPLAFLNMHAISLYWSGNLEEKGKGEEGRGKGEVEEETGKGKGEDEIFCMMNY